MTTRRRASDVPNDTPGDPDTTYVYTRAEDRSILMKLSVIMDKYKPLIWALALMFFAFGFDFKTPNQVFGAIHKRMDTLEFNAKLTNQLIVVDKLGLEKKIDALIKIQCFDVVNKKLEREAQLAGLNCTAPVPINP